MRKSMVSTRYAISVAALNCILYHVPLFVFAVSTLDMPTVFSFRVLFQLLLIVFSVTVLVLYLLGLMSPRCLKYISIGIFLGNAIALYFVSTYGVFLDKSMMGNVWNTRVEEVADFFGIKLILYFFFLGVVPAVVLSKIKVHRAPTSSILLQSSALVFTCLLVIYFNASVVLWFDQYSRRLGGLMLPWSYTVNSLRSQWYLLSGDKKVQLLPSPISINSQKSLVVLVIGEAARANNFTAYGYDRETHPRLSAAGAVFLQDAVACATYTTASIRCMLSHDGSPDSQSEPLPSYLQRHNVHVIWRTNNWGEPELNLNSYTKAAQLRSQCEGLTCAYDEVLLQGLSTELTNSENDKILLVLHTKGSHGPAYHKRYPEGQSQFKPVCTSVDLSKCTSTELVNAYDNTIVYTDYFIDRTIQLLNQISDRPVAMIYISDHGESLGEYGLYLHGTPNFIAPDYQLSIPFIVWMSERFKQVNGAGGLQFDQNGYSHANVFHSVLGALGMKNSVYNESLDIFNPYLTSQ